MSANDKLIVNFTQGPDYLATTAEYAEQAEQSAQAAAQSANDSSGYADVSLGHAEQSEASALASANSATASANSATASANSAIDSSVAATASSNSAVDSANSATSSQQSANAASASADSAASNQIAAQEAAGAAASSAAAASDSAGAAAGSAETAAVSANAAATSASTAISNANVASSAATTATTKAAQAVTSVQQAQAAATAASVSASTATTQAQAAANSATTASTAATTATDKAQEAATSAEEAATSAEEAAEANDQAKYYAKVTMDKVATAAVGYPHQDGTLTYNGQVQTPTWDVFYEPNKMTVTGQTSGTNAGTYTITMTPKSGFYWWDTDTTTSRTQTWEIDRATVDDVPSQASPVVYNGQPQSPTWADYDPAKLTIGGTTSATNMGTYTATFTPTSNYEWYDGTTTAKSVQWTINAQTVSVPTVTNTSFTYNGNSQGPTISTYDSSLIEVTGATATNAGSYAVNFHLKSSSLKWTDNTTADKQVAWTISPASVSMPTVTNTSLTYNGASQGPTIGTYNTTAIAKSGTSTAVVVGNYSITFSLASGNYIWSDSTTASKSVSWSIAAATVAVPTLSNSSLTYNTSAQGPTISAYDANVIQVGGTTSATNAGSYSVNFTLTSTTNYKWSDNTTAQKSVSWSIAKAAGSLSISKNSVSLTSSALTDTVTVTRAGDGAISAISGDTSIATTSISGTTITITAVGNGTTSITVSVAEGTNYLAPTALSIAVSVQLYKYMRVTIDQNDSNPETSCTYSYDATEMVPGSDEWDEFFGFYPCMLKNGVEVGRLKRDDFTKYEDGSPADITSGAEGDVMIAFPRRGIRIAMGSLKIISIDITDNPQQPTYDYSAFTRNDVIKDKIYIGAYQGSVLSRWKDYTGYIYALRSLSDATCDTGKTLDQYRTYARANGESSGLGVSGYEQMNIFQLLYLQVLYLFKYKNRDSQSAVGKGFVTSNSARTKTGGTETNGMDWGETTGKQHVKLFGIEDLWGNVNTRIDGVVTKYVSSKFYYATFKAKYDQMGDYASYSGYTVEVITASNFVYQSFLKANTSVGFYLNDATAGSDTTQWCDQGRVKVSSSTVKLMVHGGYYNYDTKAGMFMMDYNYDPSDTSSYAGARLTYI